LLTSKLTNFSLPSERGLFARYVILTAAIFVPLLLAFQSVRNIYPIAVWDVMVPGGDLARGRDYCILRGETVSGETIDIPAIELTNALFSRTWTMVNATIRNQSFKLSSVHPENLELIRSAGGVENLPSGARVPDLLDAWGRLYNERLPEASPQRLRAIRLDQYRWEGGTYSDYARFIQSWHTDL
jgi:hypothetical protein